MTVPLVSRLSVVNLARGSGSEKQFDPVYTHTPDNAIENPVLCMLIWRGKTPKHWKDVSMEYMTDRLLLHWL